jgi:hypothetical protein
MKEDVDGSMQARLFLSHHLTGQLAGIEIRDRENRGRSRSPKASASAEVGLKFRRSTQRRLWLKLGKNCPQRVTVERLGEVIIET